MNYQDKTKDELIKELQELQQKYDSLKTSYEKEITERKQPEETLLEPEILFKELIDLARDTIFSLTPQGLFDSLNQAFEKITGWQTHEWIGKPFTDLLHPEDIPLAAERFSNLLEGHTSQAVELRIRKKSGDYACTEVLASLRMKKGMITGLLGIGRDITEHKRLEEIMKKDQQELKLIIDSSPIIIFYKDIEGKFIRVNKIFAEATKLPEEEFVGKTVFDLYSDKIAQSITNDDEEVLKSGRPKLNIIEQYESASGIRWVQTDKIPICDKNGIPLGLIGFAQDITGRKLSETALQESEMRYRELANSITDVFFAMDKNLRYTFWNKASEVLTGLPAQDTLGKSLLEVFPDTPPTIRVEKVYRDVITTQQPRIFINDFVLGGKHYIFEISAYPSQQGISVFVKDITERKRAEEALHESEERFRSLYENASIGMYRTTPDGRILMANPSLLRMLGFDSFNQLAQRNLNQEGYETDYPRSKFLEAIEKHGEVIGLDSAWHRQDGNTLFVRESARAIRDDQGQILYYDGTVEDITQRKLAEEALRLEKENFRRSLDDSPLGVRIATIEGETIYANRTLLNFYGYDSLEELQKTPLKDRYTPESYLQAQKRKHQRERGDLSATGYEVSIVRKNGEIRHLQVFRKGILWNGVRQFQVIGYDITERKLAEEALRENEEHYRILFNEAMDGICLADAETGLIIDCNQAMSSLVGRERVELIGQSQKILYPLKNNKTDYSPTFKQYLTDKEGMTLETQIVTKTGLIREVEIKANPMNIHGRKVLQGVFHDITESKQAEGELRKSKELLEDMYKHLNDVRENERALISREIHDQIGQSLTALKLDLNRMQKCTTTNPETMAKLEDMVELVSNAIKDVQRISSDLRPGILDDLGLIAAIEWYCNEFEKRSGIKCFPELDNSDFTDSRISLILFRVLQETLTNVIRHANASSVYIVLGKTQKGIMLTIRDNGIGIAKEKINSNKSFGLISMRERVRQFNGNIDISSKKGKGTKLIIFIPC